MIHDFIYFQTVKMVHFDRKNSQNQAKNLGYKTAFGAKWTLGRNFRREKLSQKSLALSGLFGALA